MRAFDVMWRTRRIATFALAVTAMLPAPSGAATCQQAKLTAAGKKTAGKLKCQTTAVKLGISVSSDCLDAVELKFQNSFLKADTKGGCPNPGNDGVVETAVDQCVTSILSALGAGSPPAPPASCLRAKMKASGEKAASKLKCWAKAAATGSAVSTDCLSKAELKFGIAFTKAELKTGCAQTGDAADVEAAVDTCVGNLVALLPPSTTSSTSSSTSTSTTTTTMTSSALPSSMAALGDSLTKAFNACSPSFTECPAESWSTGSDPAVDSHYARILAKNPSIVGHASNDALSGTLMSALSGQVSSAVCRAPTT